MNGMPPESAFLRGATGRGHHLSRWGIPILFLALGIGSHVACRDSTTTPPKLESNEFGAVAPTSGSSEIKSSQMGRQETPANESKKISWRKRRSLAKDKSRWKDIRILAANPIAIEAEAVPNPSESDLLEKRLIGFIRSLPAFGAKAADKPPVSVGDFWKSETASGQTRGASWRINQERGEVYHVERSVEYHQITGSVEGRWVRKGQAFHVDAVSGVVRTAPEEDPTDPGVRWRTEMLINGGEAAKKYE